MDAQPLSRPARIAAVDALVVWAALTVLIAVAGEGILRPLDTAAGVAVVVVAALTSGLAAAALTPVFVRQSGLRGPVAGLVLGVVLGGTGLLLDGALMLALAFGYPGVGDDLVPALAVTLLLAWGLVVLVPAPVAAWWSRRS